METANARAGSGAPAIRWPRALLAAALAWWTIRLAASGDPWCFFDYANLAFHEAGHVFLSPFGSTLHFLGGTLGQCAVPVALGIWFLVRERRVLGAVFCLWWLGENLVNIARYMADARDLALPLVGGGDHDWNELFFRFGLLTEPAVLRVSGATRGIGLLLMAAGALGCALLAALPRAAARTPVRAGPVRPARVPAARKATSAANAGPTAAGSASNAEPAVHSAAGPTRETTPR